MDAEKPDSGMTQGMPRTHEASRARGGIRPHVLARVMRLIDQRLAERLPVEELASEACLSPFHFARMFKQSTGLSPHAFITARRMEHAKRLLSETPLSVLEVGRRSGFTTQAHFCSVFRAQVGVTPAAYRRQQRQGPATTD